MSLEMRTACEICGRKLEPRDEAYICTFCSDCTSEREGVCPNCGGELVRRPRAGKAKPEA